MSLTPHRAMAAIAVAVCVVALAQPLIDQDTQTNGLPVYLGSVLIGRAPAGLAFDAVAPSGGLVLFACSAAAGRVTCRPQADTAFLASLITVQSGQVEKCVAFSTPTDNFKCSPLPAPPALVHGMAFWLNLPHDNSGPATLDVGELGARPVLKDGAALIPQAHRGGRWRRVVFNETIVTGGAWELQ